MLIFLGDTSHVQLPLLSVFLKNLNEFRNSSLDVSLLHFVFWKPPCKQWKNLKNCACSPCIFYKVFATSLACTERQNQMQQKWKYLSICLVFQRWFLARQYPYNNFSFLIHTSKCKISVLNFFAEENMTCLSKSVQDPTSPK